jgi:hypothetical protein
VRSAVMAWQSREMEEIDYPAVRTSVTVPN